MFSYLAITDGTTTIELTDGVNYALVSYAPGVAPLRESLLGGQGPYDVVADTITVHAMGTTAALAYAAADALQTLIEQSFRWWQGEKVGAVTLRAIAQDSTVATISAPQIALVRGRAPGTAAAGLALPAMWHEYFGKYVIQNIVLSFVRSPLWVGATQTATSNTAGMPAVLTATFAAGAVGHLTPTVATLSGPLQRSALAFQLGYLLIAPQNRIELIEAETMANTGTGTATPTADAAAHASNGSIMRLSVAPNHAQLVKTFSAPFAANAFQVAVFATIRINATPTGADTMQAVLFRNSLPVEGPIVPVTNTYFGAAGIPQPVFLGIIDMPPASPATSVQVSVDWFNSTFDIDVVVCIALNNSYDARVIASVSDPTFYTPFNGVSATSPLSIVYDPQNLTQIAPGVIGREATTGTDEPWPVNGDAYLVSKDAIMTALWLTTQSTFWRPWDTTAAAQISFTLALSRRAPFLLPQ
jgi:hypothetical protein